MQFRINRQQLDYDHGHWTADAVERMARAAIEKVYPGADIKVENDLSWSIIDVWVELGETREGRLAVDAARDIFDRMTTEDGDGWIPA